MPCAIKIISDIKIVVELKLGHCASLLALSSSADWVSCNDPDVFLINFGILPKIFYQNICLIVPCCNTCKDPNALLHPE
jgi:hypothetical protein